MNLAVICIEHNPLLRSSYRAFELGDWRILGLIGVLILVIVLGFVFIPIHPGTPGNDPGNKGDVEA